MYWGLGALTARIPRGRRRRQTICHMRRVGEVPGFHRRRRVLPPEWAAQLEGGPHPGWRSLGLRAKLQHPVPSLSPVGRRDQTSGTGDAITPKWPRPYVPIPRYPSTSYPTSHIPHPTSRRPHPAAGVWVGAHPPGWHCLRHGPLFLGGMISKSKRPCLPAFFTTNSYSQVRE